MADLDRIKRNVSKMVGGGAPASDIDAYIAGEGVTLDAVRGHRLGSAPAQQPGSDYVQPAPPPGMEFDPATGRMIDTAQRELVRARQDPGLLARVPDALARTGRMADDFVRGLADIPTLGLADELAAKANEAVGSGDYDTNLAAERQRDAEGGNARLAGQIGGALILPGMGARTVGGAALQSGLQGAAYGFGSGEGGIRNRVENAAVSGGIGLGLGAGVQGVANTLANRAARATIPTTQELKAAGSAAYDAAEKAGVIFRPERVQALAGDIAGDLADFGYHPQLQPRVAAVLNEVDRLSQGNVTLKGVDVLRRIAGSAASSADRSERAIAARIVERIDEMVGRATPADVLAGNADEAANAMLLARSNWAQMRKSEMVEEALTKADNRAASTGTGGNSDNAIRQNMRAILDDPKKLRGFTEAEKAALRQTVRGTGVQNAARLAGRLSPRGNGLMAALGGGSIVANPALAVPAMIGADLAKRYADRATTKNAQALLETIRAGGKNATQLALEAAEGRGDLQTVAYIQNMMRRAQELRAGATPLAATQAQEVQTYLPPALRPR